MLMGSPEWKPSATNKTCCSIKTDFIRSQKQKETVQVNDVSFLSAGPGELGKPLGWFLKEFQYEEENV